MPLMLEQHGDVQLLTLDYPPHNTLDLDAVADIDSIVRNLSDQPLVITGAGSSFSAGVNTKAFFGYGERERQELFTRITGMIATVLDHGAPVVAAINGHALGGGFVLMLCADYRVAAAIDGARFGLTEAAAGVPFPDGALTVIQRELPPTLLRSLALTSRTVTVDELLSRCVVDELLPESELLQGSIERARSLAAQPAFLEVKRQVRGYWDLAG